MLDKAVKLRLCSIEMVNLVFMSGSSQQGKNFRAPAVWMCGATNHLPQFNNFYNFYFK